MKKNRKILIYRFLLILLIIAAVIIGGVIFHKQYEDQVYEKENKELVIVFHEEISKMDNENSKNDKKEKKKIDLKYKGQKVIGLIEIPAIDLEYPILEKTTKLAMATSISRYYGGEINEYGNVSLAGHNNYSGTMFGRNKNLKKGDKVLLTDLTGKTLEYEIYDIFVTHPDDTKVLETKDKTIRVVTLITCKNGRSERLIIKAKEIIKS